MNRADEKTREISLDLSRLFGFDQTIRDVPGKDGIGILAGKVSGEDVIRAGRILNKIGREESVRMGRILNKISEDRPARMGRILNKISGEDIPG